MSEKPILFSGPMVRAILDGAKTQTRRLVKQQVGEVIDGVAWYPDYYEVNGDPGSEHQIPSPVSVGDALWVKETWRSITAFDDASPTSIAEQCGVPWARPAGPVMYDADGSHNAAWLRWVDSPLADAARPGKTRVSIHMPRWASRLTLRVTDVRVERLGDISDVDARAEGAMHWAAARTDSVANIDAECVVFRHLWEHVHGDGAWERDRTRWVWAYAFEVVR